MLGIIACKVTYTLSEEGWLIPADAEQSWPVFEKPFVFENVTLQSELDFRKNGIDIIVFGKAVSPYRKPVPAMKVIIECGRIFYEVDVFGERLWQRLNDTLIPSAPIPFDEMPLTNDRAYGGAAVWEGIELTHSINPEGRGFYISKTEAEGKPLPNLERPDFLIQAFEDQPRPACLFKPNGMYFDQDVNQDNVEKIFPDLVESPFNQAVPELVASPQDLGNSLRLVGFSADGEILFPMPPINGPTAHVSVGDLRGCFNSTISSLIVLAEAKALIVTYLCLFRYLVRPMEVRNVELRWSEDPSVEPVKIKEGSYER